MVDPVDLADMCATNEALMPEPCTLSRGGLALDPQPTMTNGDPLRCRVQPLGTAPTPGGTILDQQERWLLTLPKGILLAVGDRIDAMGNVYGVVVVADPESHRIGTRATCVLLFILDDQGNPVQQVPLPNAVVTVLDRPGQPTAITAVPARIESPSPRDQLLTGGLVKYVVLLPASAAPQLGDQLFILSWPPFVVNPTKAYRVLQDGAPEGDVVAAWVRTYIAERQ